MLYENLFQVHKLQNSVYFLLINVSSIQRESVLRDDVISWSNKSYYETTYSTYFFYTIFISELKLHIHQVYTTALYRLNNKI